MDEVEKNSQEIWAKMEAKRTIEEKLCAISPAFIRDMLEEFKEDYIKLTSMQLLNEEKLLVGQYFQKMYRKSMELFTQSKELKNDSQR